MKFNPCRWVAAGLLLAIVVAMLAPMRFANAMISAQLQTPEQKAKVLLDRLSPREKVGQLFLVTFKGRQTGEETQIYELIVNRRVGGVVLRSANDNFTGPNDTLAEVYRLTTELQTTVFESSQLEIRDPLTRQSFNPQYIPLFIAVSQEGDGYPHDQILNGTTLLPNLMAIGATWKAELAQAVGAVMGKELQALGFNLYLGPSLDVLDIPSRTGGEDLGTRTFGGDPYWVGELGKSYITGIHQGSANQVAVIAKHFPGRGSSDRPPDLEVATVRKSLEQLKQIELAPFFAVTGNSPSPEAAADGLLVSHIRYQGFQGNIRATTRPVSLDPTAFETLMNLPQFVAWREQGGIVVSDDLGSAAVRRLYNNLGQLFEARQVARNAFLAGNDLLYVDNFVGSGETDSYTTILRTLEFFEQKYREDSAFAQRVDASVARLLAIKFRVYPDFSLEQVLPPPAGLDTVGQSQQVTFQVAQQAATLISPEPAELSLTLARPPTTRERIVFIMDTLDSKQCSQCATQSDLAPNALENAVLRLYGPKAGGEVQLYQLSSYTFLELTNLLNGLAGFESDLKVMENEIRSADWVVFSMLNIQNTRPESFALRRFLSERPDLSRNKRLVVFAFNAPYYLDATDSSKLTAYYAMYSKAPAFIEMAARLLFQETTPSGALPVTVPGVGYDLITATSPDPEQVIPLFVDLPALEEPEPGNGDAPTTPEPTPIPLFKVGDTLLLRTGIILDHNNKPVPDGTVARFIFTTGGDVATTQQIETTTKQGVASAAYRIQSDGLLEIRAASDPAMISEILKLDIPLGEAVAVTAIAPTVIVTATPEPVIESTTTTENDAGSSSPKPPLARFPLVTWLLSMLVVWGSAGSVFWIGSQRVSLRWGVRWGILALLGGILAYTLYAVFGFSQAGSLLGLLTVVICGSLIGWLSGWLWHYGFTHMLHQIISNWSKRSE